MLQLFFSFTQYPTPSENSVLKLLPKHKKNINCISIQSSKLKNFCYCYWDASIDTQFGQDFINIWFTLVSVVNMSRRHTCSPRWWQQHGAGLFSAARVKTLVQLTTFVQLKAFKSTGRDNVAVVLFALTRHEGLIKAVA